ncbi:Chitinase 2 [Carabus blaptoides fortunei]
MFSLSNKYYYFIVLFYILYQNVNYSSAATGPNHGKLVVCYIGTWAVYRPGQGSFSIEHLDPSMCTHVVYSFVGLNITHDGIRSLDPFQDLTEDYGKGGFNRVTSLRTRYPHLKVTVAIGGWNEGSTNYSQLVADPARRGRFVANAVEFVRKHNFDGLDLDWEFPGKRGGDSRDKINFVLLVKELRNAFNKFNLLLTAAFGAGKDTIDVAYDVPNLSHYLDYVHLMCYDYHGAWDQKTGANAPLHANDVLSVEYSVKYMIELGMDPSKLIMGLALYGRTFYLTEETLGSSQQRPTLGALAKNVGFQGSFSRENGFMGYNEICLELKNTTSNWTKHWDETTQTPFAINGDKVITYDDERSIAEKVRFAIKQKLGGAMVWSIDTDDFRGDCAIAEKEVGSDQRFNDNYPLMRTINEAIVKTLEETEADKENEIPDEPNRTKDTDDKGSSSMLQHSLLFVFVMPVIFLY